MLPDKVFQNIFADPQITDLRLSAFATDTLSRIDRLDTAGKYNEKAAAVANARQELQQHISGVDQHLNHRKGKTGEVNGFVSNFKQRMSELEGVIANAVGGYESAAYLDFYPHGITEYRIAVKAQVPVLLDRIYEAAGLYGAQLGTATKDELQSFRGSWAQARGRQEQAKGSVSDSRAGRNSARRQLEVVLMQLVYTIAHDHADNPEAGKAWFDFTLLASAAHPSLRRHKDDPEGPSAD